jgi:DNA-binding protein YbaB
MSESPHESFQKALEELRRTQERLRTVQSKLQDNATKFTSKDGMVTVTLDGRSEVTSIAFNTAKFRRMAPAELDNVLVETIRQARVLGRSRITDAYRPLMPKGMDIDAIMAGKFSLDKMFDEAAHRGETMMAEVQKGASNGHSASTSNGHSTGTSNGHSNGHSTRKG